MKVGLHVSIAGGIQESPIRAAENQAECFQIFTRSPRGGPAPLITKELLGKQKNNLKKTNISNFYTHTPYYINLASESNKIYYNSIRLIREDLERSSKLGAKALMTHLGSAKDLGEAASRKKVAKAMQKVLDNYSGSTSFLIENSAGSGRIIGSSLDEIRWLIKEVEKKNKKTKIGLCYDTCHGFASGYDIRDQQSANKTIKEIENKIGIKRLSLIHTNDSKTDLGSKVDRHEHIGEGKIGKKGFGFLLNHKKLKKVDMILETPPTPRKDKKSDILILKELRTEK